MNAKNDSIGNRLAMLVLSLLLLATGACDVQHPPANTELILGVAIAME